MTRKRDAATHLGYCRFRCRQCGRRFNERTGTPFNHLEFPTDIVFQVVVFRLLFKLSLRDLVRMFLMRGYEFTHETVREWEERFAPLWLSAASAVSKLIFHYELTPQEKKIAAPAVHYGFGTSVAAAYGAAVEVLPVLRTGWGMPLGAAVWLGAHVIAVPALGLSEPVTKSTPRKEAVEFGAHLVYGAVVESIRRLLRTTRR